MSNMPVYDYTCTDGSKIQVEFDPLAKAYMLLKFKKMDSCSKNLFVQDIEKQLTELGEVFFEDRLVMKVVRYLSVC